MESTIMTLVFRAGAILIGLVMAFFSYKIYKHTIGASKGWFYMALFGVSLFIWSSTAMFFKSFFDVFTLRVIFGVSFLLLMAFFSPLAYVKLLNDFKFNIPKWLNPRFTVSLVAALFVTIFVINASIMGGMFASTDMFMRKLLSISHWTLGLVTIYTVIPTFYLMKITKKMPWILAFTFIIITGTGLNIGQYYDGCCWSGGELKMAGDEVCSAYDLDYVSVYPEPCSPLPVGIGKMYQLFLLVGLIIGDISFYKLWRNLDF